MGIVRRRWVIVAIAVAGLVVAAVVALGTRVPLTSEILRKRLVAALEERLDSGVELESITLRILPRLHAEGTGLKIRHKRRTDVPPLISVTKLVVDGDVISLWRRHVSHVKLEGLHIQIPPGDDDEDDEEEDKAKKKAAEASLTAANTNERLVTPDHADDSSRQVGREVVVDDFEAPYAELTILRRDKKKMPRTWYMHKLQMRSVGIESKMPFEALLTNAVPPGEINTEGTFGPWNRDNPGITPLNGKFTFADANLGVFGGISGILSAHGTYQGSLARIAVDGETDTPDFMVTISGHQVPLKTKYHALVDGTNGNTTLDPVNATFLNTSLVAQGGVYELDDRDGREVRLDVRMESGRLEDIMKLAVKTAKPPMKGALYLTTKLILPPGKIDVIEKLQLDGRFAISKGSFTDPGVQNKINDLSGLASGTKPPATMAGTATSGAGTPSQVTSDFTGQFTLAKGILSLPIVTFDVPGAIVEMKGQYALRPETIDFAGNLFMDAKISETVTGWKAFLAKIVDPLFRKNGKTVIPLKVSGSRSAPKFGVDAKKALTRNTPETPEAIGPKGKP